MAKHSKELNVGLIHTNKEHPKKNTTENGEFTIYKGA